MENKEIRQILTISLSRKQNEYLEHVSKKKGQTKSEYIKELVFPKELLFVQTDMLDTVIDRVKTLSRGAFSIPELFTSEEWSQISKGERISLGKSFYQAVENGRVHDVECIKKKDSKTHSMLYMKL